MDALRNLRTAAAPDGKKMVSFIVFVFYQVLVVLNNYGCEKKNGKEGTKHEGVLATWMQKGERTWKCR